MSAIIDQLIEKCLTDHRHYVDGRGNITETVFDRHKFAELIIKECCFVAGPEDSYTDEWFKAKVDSITKIKKHFELTK